MAVFLPVAFMKGIVGRFFFQFGLTVSFAVAVSALVSFTVTPMLASLLLREHSGQPALVFRPFSWFLDHLDRMYRGVLGWALRHRWITLGLAMVSMVVAFGLVGQVKKEFIPPEDRAEFQVNVELPVGSSLELTRRFIEAVAKDLREHAPGVDHTFVTVGGGDQGQVHQAQVNIQMSPRDERTFHQMDAMAWVRERYKDVNNVTFSVVPINAVSGGGFRNQMVQFNVRGPDLEKLAEVTRNLVAELKKIPGFVDLDTTHRTGRPEVAIQVDRERAGDLGVPIAAIATTLRHLIAGDKVSELKEGLDIYDVTMELPEGQKAGIESLSNLKVRSQTGQLVDMSNVVRVVPESGPGHDRAPGPPAPGHRAGQPEPGPAARRGQPEGGRGGRQGGAGRPDGGLRRHGRDHGRVVPVHGPRAHAGGGVRLHAAGGAVQQLRPPVHHHAVAAAVGGGRVRRALRLRLHAQHLLDDRRHHADGPGDQERHPAGRLHQHAARAAGCPCSRRCSRPARSGCGRS